MKKKKLFLIQVLGITLLVLVALCLAIPSLGVSLALPALAWLCPKALLGAGAMATKGVVMCAALPFGMVLRKADAEEGGGATLDDIAEKVDKGIGGLRTKQEQLLGDIGRLDKDTKKALEDITALKKTANDQQANTDEFVKKLKTFEALMRREQRMAFGNPVQRVQADEKLRAQFNLAVRAAVNPDGRLKEAVGVLTKALGEDSSPGSTLLLNEIADEIYHTLATYGVWSGFKVQRIGTKTLQVPVKTARVQAGWLTSEAATIGDDTNKAGATSNVSVLPFAALLNVSLQLLEDAEYDITGDIMEDFAEACAFVLDNTVFNADATNNSTYGGFTGIFGGGTAATAANGNVTVEKLDFEDITRVLLAVDPVVLQRQAKWWMHPQILVRLLSIKDGNGRPIFLTALEAPAAGNIGSILGYPVVPAFAAPSTNAASAKVAAFGDPNAMLIPLRRDYTFEASDHHKWNTLQRSFRGYGRAAVKLRSATGMAVLTLPAA